MTFSVPVPLHCVWRRERSRQKLTALIFSCLNRSWQTRRVPLSELYRYRGSPAVRQKSLWGYPVTICFMNGLSLLLRQGQVALKQPMFVLCVAPSRVLVCILLTWLLGRAGRCT